MANVILFSMFALPILMQVRKGLQTVAIKVRRRK